MALPFGSAWHATIARALYDQGDGHQPDAGELKATFRHELDRELRQDGPPVLFEGEETEAVIVEIGGRMIQAFLEQVPRPDNVLGLEVPFSIEAYDPATGELLGVPIIGALDGVLEEHGGTVVLELKSGKKRWSDEKIAHDLQASVYRAGAKSRGIPEPEQRLVVTTKSERPQVQIERLVRTDDDELEVMDTAANVLRAIEAGVDHRIRSWRCASCPVAGACGT